MQQWEYKVASVDYRGRISIEGHETLIGSERRTAFLRQFLDTLGEQGWELISIQPLGQHDAYYIFKRPRGSPAPAGAPSGAHVGDEAPTTL